MSESDEVDINATSPAVPNVLRVVHTEIGIHLVNAGTLEAASNAPGEADATPYYADYGELRRSGDLEFLADRLQRGFGLTLEEYADEIERSADLAPASPDISARLAALDDVDFDGTEDGFAPPDRDDFRAEWELDNEVEVENLWAHTVAMGMCDDVPSDILAEFNAFQHLMFVDYQYCAVPDDQLDAMIAALQARGFTVERETA